MNKIILLSGSSAVGKTSLLKWLVLLLKQNNIKPGVCKIDCFDNHEVFDNTKLNVPFILGVSGDTCPDHFMVTNLAELWSWGENNNCDTLLIETAGLCHRCSPATEKMVSGCVVDATSSTKAPQSLGPMLFFADFIVVTKIDMVSQAEREIILWKIRNLNKNAKIFAVDTLAGYGVENLAKYLADSPNQISFEGDKLRHTMPMGVCSYCVGECRVGKNYEQGVINKIDFSVAHNV